MFKSHAVKFAIAGNLYLGLCRALESANRYHSTGYDSAKRAFHWTGSPIHAWGVMFLVVGVALCLVQRGLSARLVAGVGMLLWTFWGALSLASAGESGTTSFGGGGLYFLIAAIHLLLVVRQPVDQR